MQMSMKLESLTGIIAMNVVIVVMAVLLSPIAELLADDGGNSVATNVEIQSFRKLYDDVISFTNGVDKSVTPRMSYEALDYSAEWKELDDAEVDEGEEENESSLWKECKDDPTWFENAQGERISVERYCAIVNAECARSAVTTLNRDYTVCDSQTAKALVEAFERLFAPNDTDSETGAESLYNVYRMTDDIYILMDAEGGGTMNMHSYYFVFWDGKIMRQLVTFYSLPTSARVLDSIKQARENPAALNNLAAMIYNDYADHHGTDGDYLRFLLETAAVAGDPMACRNLSVLYRCPYSYADKNEKKSEDWLSKATICAQAISAGGGMPAMKTLEIGTWPKMFGSKDYEIAPDDVAALMNKWLAPYQKRTDIKIERDGDDIYIYGTFGALPSIFSTFDVTVVVYGKEKEVSFVAYLPTVVSKERRKSMTEFIFRAEIEYGISPASIILEEDGRVRCQAWLPFESIAHEPRESQWRLVGAVIDKLWAFSEGVAKVSLGGNPVSAASSIKRIVSFEGLNEAEGLKKIGADDTKKILERCFDEDAGVTVTEKSDALLDKFTGRGGDVEVGIIEAHFEDVVRDIGGRYDVIPYYLVVREGMVWNVCNIPDEIPDIAIDKAADLAMRMNEQLKYSLFNIDFDTGRMWCCYGLPVSAIPPCDEQPPRNLYGALIKFLPIKSVATSSEDSHLNVVQALLRTDDDEGVSIPIMESLSQQAATVATWLQEHLKDVKCEVTTNGVGRISVSGLVRGNDPNADACLLNFDIDAICGRIVCRGELSKPVSDAKLAEVQELLSHYGFRSSVSAGALALSNEGKVRYSESVPLLALRDDLKGTVCKLASNVLLPMMELSEATMRICYDGQKPEDALQEASYPKDLERLLKDPDVEEKDWDATSEEEAVIESWFNDYGVKYERGIENELTVYYRDRGEADQSLQECFVMRGDMVLSQCRLNLEIPVNRRQAVSAYALAHNAADSAATMHMGYCAELGDSIYFQYAMPVSILLTRERNSSAKENFERLLDMPHRVALEVSPRIQELVRGQNAEDGR